MDNIFSIKFKRSHSVGRLFILLIVSSMNGFSFPWSPLFFFDCPCFWCHIQETVVKSNVMSLTPCFLLWVLQFYVSDLFWVNFCMWCKGKGPTLFFCIFSSFLRTTCWKDCSFPHWMVLAALLKTRHVREDLFQGSLFYSIGLYICPYVRFALFWLL